MKYNNICEGIFIKRLNRFIAKVNINSREVLVYIPNTGRCKELFIKGAKCYVCENFSHSRKTNYTLISVEKNDMLINVDSMAPNNVVEEAIKEKKLDFGFDIINYKREYKYDKSRFDFYLEGENKKAFLEVKGVTLENNGLASFPDAPTLRGLKHIKELIKAKEEGYDAYILFLIQMHGPNQFYPNYKRHYEFAEELEIASEIGVNILVYDSTVKVDEITLANKISYNLDHIVLRLADYDDKDSILKIYDDGSKSLKAMGVDQWQGSYKPNLDNMQELLNKKTLYVLDDKIPVATAILTTYEEDYNKIDGKYIYGDKYLSIHRFAVAGNQRNKGYARKFFNKIEDLAKKMHLNVLRIDTHRDNYKMQDILRACGFRYAGIMYFKGKIPRDTFEKPLYFKTSSENED